MIDRSADRDGDSRDVDMPWLDVRDVPDRDHDDVRDRDDDARERDRDAREGAHDPRDAFVEGLDLPRGVEREIVLDGDRRYELNGDDSRTLATLGAFRAVAESDPAMTRPAGVSLTCATCVRKGSRVS